VKRKQGTARPPTPIPFRAAAEEDGAAQKRARAGGAVGEPSAHAGKEEVGRRARVWWGGDRKWYEGTLVRFQQGKHEIAYDDGISMWCALASPPCVHPCGWLALQETLRPAASRRYRLADERWELLRA
jgi:hypothetical protein